MNNTPRIDDDAERASIFTVPVRRIRPHFWTFSICFIATTIFYVYIHACNRRRHSIVPRGARSYHGRYRVSRGVLDSVQPDTGRRSRQEGRLEGREEGRAAGRKEMNAAWREWNRRRQEAIAEGRPFDEPTPDSTNGADPPSA